MPEDPLRAKDESIRPPLTVGSVLVVVACAVAGWFAFHVPYDMAFASGATKARNPVDGMQPVSLLGIGVIGLAAGLLRPRGWLIWGLCSMAALPCVAVVEMVRDPNSHNLWPIEFVLYGVFSVPGVLGAGIGALFRNRWRKRLVAEGRPAVPPAPPLGADPDR